MESNSPATLVLAFAMIACITGVMVLVWNCRNRYRGKDSLLRYAVRKPLVWVVLGTFGTIVGVNLLLPEPEFTEPYATLVFAKQRKLASTAAHAYRELADRYPFCYHYHYGYVTAYFHADFWAEEADISTRRPADLYPISYYDNLRITSPHLEDVGRMGLAMARPPLPRGACGRRDLFPQGISSGLGTRTGRCGTVQGVLLPL